ncbi:MAG: transcription factor S [Candidatus Bathyarchaeota archaeon]|nr:transcription factor S [Candidatus Bathyarchaeota archaeon]
MSRLEKIFKSRLRRGRNECGERVMEFCPKCGKRLVLQKKDEESKVLACTKCGFKKKTEGENHTKVPLARNELKPFQESIAVIGKEEQKLRTLPTVRMECPKCGNNLAFAWQVQTRGSDESSTQFFRCTKCSFTFREYT